MNKAELTAAVAAKTGQPQSQVGEMVDETIDAIQSTLARGGEVNITGFGKFSVAHRGARQGRNPATGATIQIGPSKSPKFSAGAKFKAAVKGG